MYASKEYPVDVHDARNLILTRTTRRQLTTRTGNTPTYYAVTTTDGFGNETKVTQLLDAYEIAYRQADDEETRELIRQRFDVACSRAHLKSRTLE